MAMEFASSGSKDAPGSARCFPVMLITFNLVHASGCSASRSLRSRCSAVIEVGHVTVTVPMIC
jgi:hypothetical protein